MTRDVNSHHRLLRPKKTAEKAVFLLDLSASTGAALHFSERCQLR